MNDGGPAFPGESGEGGYGHSKRFQPVNGDPSWIDLNQGMSLRAYIATKALAAIVGNSHVAKFIHEAKLRMTPEEQVAFDTNIMPKATAASACALADALIAELEKGTK